jgi:hypothetical protein
VGIPNFLDPFGDMTTDSKGNVYISCLSTINNNSDYGNVILSKYSIDGQLIWSKYFPEFGIFGNVYINSLVGNIDDYCIFAGSYYGEIDFETGQEISISTPNESSHGFILLLDKDGNLIWVKNWGNLVNGNKNPDPYSFVYIHDMCISDSGNIDIVGSFNKSIKFEDNSKPIQLQATSGENNLYIAATDKDGNLIFANSIDGAYEGHGIGLIIGTDIYGNIYLLGPKYSNNCDFDPGFDSTYNSSNDEYTFIVKFDPMGDYIWYRELPIYQAKLDVDKDVIEIIGIQYNNEDLGEENHQGAARPQNDLLITMDLDGNIINENIIKAINQSAGIKDFIVEGDNTLITGLCNSNVSSGITSYIAKYNENWEKVWEYKFGNDGTYGIEKIEIDNNGYFYLAGIYKNDVEFPECFGIEGIGKAENYSTYLIKLVLVE